MMHRCFTLMLVTRGVESRLLKIRPSLMAGRYKLRLSKTSFVGAGLDGLRLNSAQLRMSLVAFRTVI
ncbi:hypothetical protein DJ84_21885 [Halorubrum ezzemoulense]|nr:hypothetical protein DJ84_21885 [Halorubrum ezzemoulense]